MLAAGAQPQAEAGLVQRHIGQHQGDEGQEHEPVELKAGDVDDKGLLGLNILDGGGDVVHVLRGVHGLDKARRMIVAVILFSFPLLSIPESASLSSSPIRHIDKKYRQSPPSENKLMTQNVRIGLNAKKHRRNLNTLVCGSNVPPAD